MRLAVPHKVLGIVFLCLLLLGVWLTYAVFTKKFSDYDEVTLQTSKIGLQLPSRADVKVRGVIVGEVLEFEANPEGAELTLGLYPGEIDSIPADVTGSIVPKTLFGEKYVSLEIPEGSSTGEGEALQAGADIERTDVAIEVEEVLSDLYPLLRTVQPAELNMTLNALATALEGRGEELGQNLETLDSYLKRLNPQIPQIVDDLRLTARVSDTYADVMPEIAEILRNTITTTGTFEDQDDKVRALYEDVASFSDTSREFLDANGDNLIRLGELGQQQLRVFAKYAPEYPCLLKGIVNAAAPPGGGLPWLHPPHRARDDARTSRAATTAADKPRYGETRGHELPQPAEPALEPAQPGAAPARLRRRRRRADRQGHQPGRAVVLQAGDRLRRRRRPRPTCSRPCWRPALGVSDADVPDLGMLLVGPMARGAEVSLR